MNIRVCAAIVIVSVVAVDLSARNPFGRVRNSRRSIATVNESQIRRPVAQSSLFQSPVEMTKRFGPSILVRESANDVKVEKYVTQPNQPTPKEL